MTTAVGSATAGHTVLADADGSAYRSLLQRPVTRAERYALGKSLRRRVPRRSLAEWTPPADRPDPVDLIMLSHQRRVELLIPVRVGRMVASPYGFLRDPLLGWATVDGRQYYVRQFRNMKGTIPLDTMDADTLTDDGGVVGALLAKGHARTSGSSMIAGYGPLRPRRQRVVHVRAALRRPDRGRPRRARRRRQARAAAGGASGVGDCTRRRGPSDTLPVEIDGFRAIETHSVR